MTANPLLLPATYLVYHNQAQSVYTSTITTLPSTAPRGRLFVAPYTLAQGSKPKQGVKQTVRS